MCKFFFLLLEFEGHICERRYCVLCHHLFPSSEYKGPFNFVLEYIYKFHGLPSSQLTRDCNNTGTVSDVFAGIGREKVLQAQHKTAEWSMNRCDYCYNHAAAEQANYTQMIPPLSISFL